MTPWASVTLAARPGQGPAPVAVPTRTAATTADASAAAQALLLIDLSTPAMRRRFPNEPYTPRVLDFSARGRDDPGRGLVEIERSGHERKRLSGDRGHRCKPGFLGEGRGQRRRDGGSLGPGPPGRRGNSLRRHDPGRQDLELPRSLGHLVQVRSERIAQLRPS